jgi:hypothetical protein
LVLLLLLAGCGAALPPLPSQGGPAWRELSSMHFTLWTDAPPERGRELVQQMEWLRSIIYGVAFPDLPAGGKTFVVALRDIRESRVFTPPYHDAYAMAGGPLRRPMIVMPADAYGDERMVTHELTHAISYNAIHRQPRWFSEGLATFFETIDMDMARGTVDVGALRYDVRASLDRDGIFSAERMLACDRMACTDDFRFYATAWTMYAFLHYKHPAELARYELALDSMPADQAWQQAMAELPAQALDHELLGYLKYGGYAIAHFKIEKRQWPIAERPLADADVDAIRAFLHWQRDRSSPDAERELAAALAADRANVLAVTLDTYIHKRKPLLDEARAVTVAHPDDFLAWLLLAQAARDRDEQRAAHDKVCALIADDPAAQGPRDCHNLSPTPPPSSPPLPPM